jgi:hypothetical protein
VAEESALQLALRGLSHMQSERVEPRFPIRLNWPACRRSFLDRNRCSANPLPRALSFGGCPVGLRVTRKTGL